MLIEAFDPKTAGDAEWQALNRFANSRRQEEWPDDLPLPVEKTRLDMTVIKDNGRRYTWVAWQGEDIIGKANLWVEDAETNTHLAWLDLWVLAPTRGQGLGRQLLALAAETARCEGRRLLMGETDSYAPAGDAFTAHLGASKRASRHQRPLLAEGFLEVFGECFGTGDRCTVVFHIDR